MRGRGSPRRGNGSLRSNVIDSNGPDIKIRGNVYQVLEKYLVLARDAYSAGDRIASENFYQHAEHYYRVIGSFGGAVAQGRGADARKHGDYHEDDRLAATPGPSEAPSERGRDEDDKRLSDVKESPDFGETGAGETRLNPSKEADKTSSEDPEKGESSSI